MGNGSRNSLFQNRRLVTIRVMLTYLQILGSVGELRARGPALLRSAIGYSQSIAGGITVGTYIVKCALGWGFYDRFWAGMALPFVLMIATFQALFLASRLRHEKSWIDMSALGTSVVKILFLTYSQSTQNFLRGASCSQCVLFLGMLRFCGITTRFPVVCVPSPRAVPSV